MNKIKTDRAPQAIGAYSQGMELDGLVFTSGQIGIEPNSGQLITHDFRSEVLQVLNNVSAVLEAGGSNAQNAIKLTVFLIDLSNFKIVNDIFIDFFNGNYPARSVIQISALPLNANIEIEAIGKKI